MNVFCLRGQLVADYSEYVRSYIQIRDPRISGHVSQRLDEGMLWPEPLIQINPSFEPGAWIDDLVRDGVLHPECARIFRKDKTPTSLGDKMRLHQHQEQAARVAKLGVNYVVTAGRFTSEAQAFAEGKSISLIDGLQLLDLVKSVQAGEGIRVQQSAHPDGADCGRTVPSVGERGAVQQSRPPEVHHESSPACPRCGSGMVLRTARRGAAAGEQFWGCVTYPRCKGTRPA